MILLPLTKKEIHDLKIMLKMAIDYEFDVLSIYNGETDEKATKLIEKLEELNKEKE